MPDLGETWTPFLGKEMETLIFVFNVLLDFCIAVSLLETFQSFSGEIRPQNVLWINKCFLGLPTSFINNIQQTQFCNDGSKFYLLLTNFYNLRISPIVNWFSLK